MCGAEPGRAGPGQRPHFVTALPVPPAAWSSAGGGVGGVEGGVALPPPPPSTLRSTFPANLTRGTGARGWEGGGGRERGRGAAAPAPRCPPLPRGGRSTTKSHLHRGKRPAGTPPPRPRPRPRGVPLPTPGPAVAPRPPARPLPGHSPGPPRGRRGPAPPARCSLPSAEGRAGGGHPARSWCRRPGGARSSHTHTELLARPGAGLRGEEGAPRPGREGEGRERGRVSAGLGQFRALRRVPAPLRSFV